MLLCRWCKKPKSAREFVCRWCLRRDDGKACHSHEYDAQDGT